MAADEQIGSFIHDGSLAQVNALHFDGAHLWFGGKYEDGLLHRVDPAEGGTYIEAIDLSSFSTPWGPSVAKITSDTTHIYVATLNNAKLIVIEKATSSVVGVGICGPGDDDGSWARSVTLDDDGNVYVAVRFVDDDVFKGSIHKFAKADLLDAYPTEATPAIITEFTDRGPHDICFDGVDLWVTRNYNRLQRINTAGTVLATYIIDRGFDDEENDDPTGQPMHVISAFGSIWVTCSFYAQVDLLRFDPATFPTSESLIAELVIPPEAAGTYHGHFVGMCATVDSIWLGSFSDNQVVRISTELGAEAVAATIETDDSNDAFRELVFDGSFVWAGTVNGPPGNLGLRQFDTGVIVSEPVSDDPCLAPGWGFGVHGTTPWEGQAYIPGGSIPSLDPFDLYFVGPCGPMSELTTYAEVDEEGPVGTFSTGSTSLDQVIDNYAEGETSYITITTSVPSTFTLDCTFKFEHLPNNFSNLVEDHIFFGVTDAAGPCVGLFFSKIGIGYAGAIHHVGSSNTLVLDSLFQHLPDSQAVVSENEYWSFRIAVNESVGACYIYITKTVDLPITGHQLKYVMPIIQAANLSFSATDRTVISVRGTTSRSTLSLDEIGLASSFIVPNYAPIADAGLDQGALVCSIVELDGSKSFDPEGTYLSYKWRLIDAPTDSANIFEGFDGITLPLETPTGFTNKFYSESLAELDGADELVAGEVLTIGVEIYNVTGSGLDDDGFYVTVDGYVLVDNLTITAFKYLRQRGISAPTSQKVTFLPDIPGLYKFDLIVSDGSLFSEPSTTVINVLESSIPRGCIPDLRFIWNYLSDFWRLVEDKERIEVFWSALAQVAASELLTLWQIDYSKSLRDVQRTFQRRWLKYDRLLKEPFPELCTIRAVTISAFITVGTSDINVGPTGTAFSVSIPSFSEEGETLTSSTTLISADAPTDETLSVQEYADQVEEFLTSVDSRFEVNVLIENGAGDLAITINAPFFFSVTSNFGTHNNSNFESRSGTAVGIKTYKSTSLVVPTDVKEGDLLELYGADAKQASQIYTISEVVGDVVNDIYNYQRIITKEEIQLPIPPYYRIRSKIESPLLNFYEELVDVRDLILMERTSSVDVSYDQVIEGGGTISSQPNCVTADLFYLLNKINHPTKFFGEYFFYGVIRRNYIPINPLVTDIPLLQAKINTPSEDSILRRNIDFRLTTFRDQSAITFDNPFDVFEEDDNGFDANGEVDFQCPTLWAETTYLDNNTTIEQNFGIPAEFTLDDLSLLPSDVDYLSAVRGLWFTYFNGPTLYNLRVGTQILLGLPFAEERGIVTEIRTDYSPTQGRILVRDEVNTAIIRSYTYPTSLELECAVGDTVEQFKPLVSGIEVLDHIKDPEWFSGYLHQGFFFEIEKFFKFLVRVDSAAFNLPALLFVKSFILRVKPTYQYPLFVVLNAVREDAEVSTTDEITTTGTLLLFDAGYLSDPGYVVDPETFDIEESSSVYGTATMYDQPRTAGGGWRNRFDSNTDPDSTPVEGVADAVSWAYDKNYLSPKDSIIMKCSHVIVADAPPPHDSIFDLGSQVYSADNSSYAFIHGYVSHFHEKELLVFEKQTVDAQTYTHIEAGAHGANLVLPLDFTYSIWKRPSAGTVFTEEVRITDDSNTISLALADGDEIYATIEAEDPEANFGKLFDSVFVILSTPVEYNFVDNLPAGTYYAYRIIP